MELILKQPANKPPFIGILFSKQYEAEKTNKSPIENYHTSLYQIVLEPNKNILSLTLNSSINTYKYEIQKFDSQKLIKFLAQTKSAAIYNFSHLIDHLGDHKVVRSITNRRLWVLKVNKIEIVFAH